MTGDIRNRERGQVVVTVAVFLVLFLILLAMAVDVGNALRQRRLLQNAADAGALAGARDICFGSGWHGDFDNQGHPARLAARDFAFRNGAQTVEVTIHGYGYHVTVAASEVVDTIFAKIIGIDTIDVAADATAACGTAENACGLWPVALKDTRWWELWNAAMSSTPFCNVPFYVWAGDNPNQMPTCYHDGEFPTGEYLCDVNDDGIDDIVNQLERAWLDFSDVVNPEFPDPCTQTGCGAAELTCLLKNDGGGSIKLGQCVGGDTGVKAGTKDGVDSRVGETVAIPIFDEFCDSATCSGQDIRAVYFACIEVLGWVKGLELDRADGELPPWKGPVIAAKVDCASSCLTNCGGTTGQLPAPWGMKAVSLIE